MEVASEVAPSVQVCNCLSGAQGYKAFHYALRRTILNEKRCTLLPLVAHASIAGAELGNTRYRQSH